jgi:myo-inositol catabolism protein IolC
MPELNQMSGRSKGLIARKIVSRWLRWPGVERDRVVRWLKTAASVPGFIGFAVGRTSFWQPLVDVEAKRVSKEEAATHIAHNFEAWIHIFEEARSA